METIEKFYFMVTLFILYSASHVEGYNRYNRYYSYDDLSIGSIVGIVIGSIVVLGIVITFIVALCCTVCFNKRSHRAITSVPINNVAMVTAQPGYPQMQPMNNPMYVPAYQPPPPPAYQPPPPPAYYDSQQQTETDVFQTPSAPRQDGHNSGPVNPFLTTTNFGNYNR